MARKTPKEKIKMKADYESGKIKKLDMSTKWQISRQGLDNMAKKEGWIFGSKLTELDTIIEEQVTTQIINTEVNRLIESTAAHLKHIKNLNTLGAINTADLAKVAQRDKTLSKVKQTEANRLMAIQKFIKLSAETHDILYRSERLAIGIKDSDKPPTVNINIGKVHELKKFADNELEIMASELN